MPFYVPIAGERMNPLNRKNICKEYGICERTRDRVLKGFLLHANDKDYIKQGKILIVDRDAFENYWRGMEQ